MHALRQPGQRHGADEHSEVAQRDVVEAGPGDRSMMMPTSHAATNQAPNRGATATSTPATISMMPTRYMHWLAVPGTRSSIHPARYMLR